MSTKSRTTVVLTVMNVLAWLVFIGLMVKAGAYLVSYGISVGNPAGSKNVYQGWNLYSVRQFSFWHYTISVMLMAVITILEAYTAYLVVRVLSRIRMEHPFTPEVSNLIERISYFILGTWIVATIFNLHTAWLETQVKDVPDQSISGEFIFLAGIVFVIAQIFKKGVEIQSENELTI